MGTGPETPHVPEEGKLRADSQGLGTPHRGPGPPASIRTSHAVEPTYHWGVRSRHVSRRRGRRLECESSAGRLAHPPHSMRVVEACSAAAARGAAFARPHCRPLITEVHSAAACAASAQSPSAALIGYDGTALFHHVAYAASYTAVQLRCRRRRKLRLAPFRQDRARHAGRKIPTNKPGKSGDEISFACNAIMYEQYDTFYYIDWAHLSGTQRPCTRLP